MEANELRIGNYVKDYNSDFFKIRQEQLCDFANGYIYLQPIELTDEFFKSFGFKLYGKNECPDSPSDWYWCKIGFNLSINYKTKKVLYVNNKLNYVHQLQNLYFALTNKELNLTK